MLKFDGMDRFGDQYRYLIVIVHNYMLRCLKYGCGEDRPMGKPTWPYPFLKYDSCQNRVQFEQDQLSVTHILQGLSHDQYMQTSFTISFGADL